MKTLFLLRHAKSDWDDPSQDDFNRPLAKRGLRDAPRVGRAFSERETPPDIVLSSPAVRAKETAALFLEAAGIGGPPVFEPRIYAAGLDELVSVVREISPSAHRALVVGHNPAFEEAVRHFTRKTQPVPTAALIRIDFARAAWADIDAGSGRLAWAVVPRELD